MWITCSIVRIASSRFEDDDDCEAFKRIPLKDVEWTGTRAWVVSCTMRACRGRVLRAQAVSDFAHQKLND